MCPVQRTLRTPRSEDWEAQTSIVEKLARDGEAIGIEKTV
jgi:hypothetical protein